MNSDSDEIDLLLAEVHIARSLARKPLDVEMPTVSHADIWAAIRRPSDQPVSLAFARSLRDDPKVAQRYRQMLQAAACGFSPVAMAASDGVVTRRIGAATLRLLPATATGAPLLVLESVAGISAVELVGEDNSILRLALPAADDGSVILSLGADYPDAATLLALLRAPQTAIYLLP